MDILLQNTKIDQRVWLHIHNVLVFLRRIRNQCHHLRYLNYPILLKCNFFIFSPSKSMIIGLFAELKSLSTRTALATGDVVVCGTVGVVITGDVVLSKQE